MAFDMRCFIVLLEKPTAVVLSIAKGMGNWGCPISLRQTLIGRASLALMYPAPILASAAELITFLMILEMTWIGQLMGH